MCLDVVTAQVKKEVAEFDVSVYSLVKTSFILQWMALAPSIVAQPCGRFDPYRLLNKGNMISKIFVLKNPKTVDKLQNNPRVYCNAHPGSF